MSPPTYVEASVGIYTRDLREKRVTRRVRGRRGFDADPGACQNSAPLPLMAEDSAGPPQITRLLREWQGGDRDALDRLIPLVYDELHLIASRHMSREWRDGTIQTTGLVNEAYTKLVDQRAVDWQNRAHFFAIAAQVMRRILLDDARRRLRDKRGGNAVRVPVEDVIVPAPDAALDAADVVAIDRALEDL